MQNKLFTLGLVYILNHVQKRKISKLHQSLINYILNQRE